MGVNMLLRKGIRSKYKSGGFIVHMYETKIVFIGKESIANFTPTGTQTAFLEYICNNLRRNCSTLSANTRGAREDGLI